MSLQGGVVLAVLCGALLHACWNALIKSATDKALDTALIHSLGCVAAVPLLAATGLPDPAAWPYIAASTVVHIGYYAALGTAASLGSYGIALWAMTRAPVAAVAALRETSVLFAAVIGTLWLREPFGAQRALGTAVIVAGVAALRFG